MCGAAIAAGHRPRVRLARPCLLAAGCWPTVWLVQLWLPWRSPAANARCQTASCFGWRRPCRAQCPMVCGVARLGPSARRRRPARCRAGPRRVLLGQSVCARRPLQTDFATPGASRAVGVIAAACLVLALAARCAVWYRPRCRVGGAGRGVGRCVQSGQTPHGCAAQSWPCRAPSP